MSRLIESIRADLSGRRFASEHHLIRADIEVIEPGYITEYKIHFGGAIQVHCKSKDINLMLDNVIRQIREEIYGDIKNRIIRLERAYYMEDDKTVRSELRDINREIFG